MSTEGMMPQYLPLLIIWLALVALCLVDLARVREHEVCGLRRRTWILVVLLVPIAGPIAWFTIGRPDHVPVTASTYAARREGERPDSPDDDPDFLATLARRIASQEFDAGARPDDDQTRPA